MNWIPKKKMGVKNNTKTKKKLTLSLIIGEEQKKNIFQVHSTPVYNTQ